MNPPTERQLEVIRLIDQGLTYTEVGEKLCISRATVQAHLRELKWRLGLQNARQVRPALRKAGLL